MATKTAGNIGLLIGWRDVGEMGSKSLISICYWGDRFETQSILNSSSRP